MGVVDYYDCFGYYSCFRVDGVGVDWWWGAYPEIFGYCGDWWFGEPDVVDVDLGVGVS